MEPQVKGTYVKGTTSERNLSEWNLSERNLSAWNLSERDLSKWNHK